MSRQILFYLLCFFVTFRDTTHGEKMYSTLNPACPMTPESIMETMSLPPEERTQVIAISIGSIGSANVKNYEDVALLVAGWLIAIDGFMAVATPLQDFLLKSKNPDALIKRYLVIKTALYHTCRRFENESRMTAFDALAAYMLVTVATERNWQPPSSMRPFTSDEIMQLEEEGFEQLGI